MAKKIELARYIDHTLLDPAALWADVEKLCAEARRFNFAAVCINPVYVEAAARYLRGSAVRVCTVVGFPLGASHTEVKVFETGKAVAGGAAEIDMVIHLGALKAGQKGQLQEEIAAVVRAAGGRLVKVILETAVLSDEEKVAACSAAKKGGAHFVKTSTGFGPGGASVRDVRLLKKAVGAGMEVKASGGVRTREAALEMIAAGATRIGTSAGVAIIEG